MSLTQYEETAIKVIKTLKGKSREDEQEYRTSNIDISKVPVDIQKFYFKQIAISLDNNKSAENVKKLIELFDKAIYYLLPEPDILKELVNKYSFIYIILCIKGMFNYVPKDYIPFNNELFYDYLFGNMYSRYVNFEEPYNFNIKVLEFLYDKNIENIKSIPVNTMNVMSNINQGAICPDDTLNDIETTSIAEVIVRCCKKNRILSNSKFRSKVPIQWYANVNMRREYYLVDTVLRNPKTKIPVDITRGTYCRGEVLSDANNYTLLLDNPEVFAKIIKNRHFLLSGPKVLKDLVSFIKNHVNCKDILNTVITYENGYVTTIRAVLLGFVMCYLKVNYSDISHLVNSEHPVIIGDQYSLQKILPLYNSDIEGYDTKNIALFANGSLIKEYIDKQIPISLDLLLNTMLSNNKDSVFSISQEEFYTMSNTISNVLFCAKNLKSYVELKHYTFKNVSMFSYLYKVLSREILYKKNFGTEVSNALYLFTPSESQIKLFCPPDMSQEESYIKYHIFSGKYKNMFDIYKDEFDDDLIEEALINTCTKISADQSVFIGFANKYFHNVNETESLLT